MVEFVGFLAGLWFLVALGAAVYFWATRTDPSQPPIVRRFIGFGLGLAWPVFVFHYLRQHSNRPASNVGSTEGSSPTRLGSRADGIAVSGTTTPKQRSSTEAGQSVKALLASGRRLRSSLSVEDALAVLDEVVSGYRPRRYQRLPHLIECGYEWLGASPMPERAVCLSDSENDFLLVLLWPRSNGCEVGMFPLGAGDERLRLPIIGHWKMQESSLTSVGTFPDGSVALRAPTVPRDLVAGCLRGAGYPETPGNLAAMREMVTKQFLLKAHQFIGSRDEQYADMFVDRHRNSDPQMILDDLGSWSAEVLPYIQDLPWRIPALLLEPEIISKSQFWAGLEGEQKDEKTQDGKRWTS